MTYRGMLANESFVLLNILWDGSLSKDPEPLGSGLRRSDERL